MDGESEESASGGRRRVWFWGVGIGGLVLILVAAGLTVFFGGDTDAESADGDCAVAHGSGVTEASAEPSDGEELGVVDFGAWPYDVFEEEPRQMTFGFELENPSEEVARNVELEYDFVGEDGEPVIDESIDNREQLMEIPVILPGQRVGMAGDSFQTQDKYVDLQEDPTSISYDDMQIEIDVVSAEWWPMDNDIHEFAEVTADPVEVMTGEASNEFDFESEKGVDDTLVRSTIDSAYCTTVNTISSSVLLRDSDGDIVGGAPPNDAEPHSDSLKSLPSGQSEPFYSILIFPEAGDRTQAEVYPYTAPAKRSAD